MKTKVPKIKFNILKNFIFKLVIIPLSPFSFFFIHGLTVQNEKNQNYIFFINFTQKVWKSLFFSVFFYSHLKIQNYTMCNMAENVEYPPCKMMHLPSSLCGDAYITCHNNTNKIADFIKIIFVPTLLFNSSYKLMYFQVYKTLSLTYLTLSFSFPLKSTNFDFAFIFVIPSCY